MSSGDASTLETSPLPVPYRNPWGCLADDLRAVVADVRLRLQECWRRNGEGSLWKPNAWPRDLAPLFWPLVVGVMVVALVSTGVMVSASKPSTVPAEMPGDVLRPMTNASLSSASSTSPDTAITETPADQPEGPSQPSSDQQPSQSRQPPVELPPPVQQEASRAEEPDPLLRLVLGRDGEMRTPSAGDAMLLVKAVGEDPERNAVTITLGGDWSELQTGPRQTLADTWWQRVEGAGYSVMILQSEEGARLGRSARVGQGMVLNAWP